MFYEGQKVVCVNNTGTPELKNGGVYVVNAIRKCPCGEVGVCVGIPPTHYKGSHIVICKTCNRISETPITQEYKPQRFSPLEDNWEENINELIESLKEPCAV